jgi:hypothetical protein
VNSKDMANKAEQNEQQKEWAIFKEKLKNGRMPIFD